MILAVIFVPGGPLDPEFVTQCLAHCSRRGYEVTGLVRGDWPAAFQMLADRVATVVVFARREHLDADREPRVEFVGRDTRNLRPHLQAPAPQPPTRRPRIIE